MTLSEIELILEELAARHTDLTSDLLRTLLTSAGWEEKYIKDALMLLKQGIKVSPKKENGPAIETAVKKVDDTAVTQVQSAVAPSVSSEIKEDITFYTPDGEEEGELHTFENVPAPARENNEPVKTVVKQEEVKQDVEPALVAPVVDLLPDIRKDLSHQEEIVELEQSSEVKKQEEQDKKIFDSKKFSELFASKDDAPKITEVRNIEPQSLIVQESTNQPQQKFTKKEAVIPEDLPLLPFESSPHVWSFSRYKNTFHSDDVKEVTQPPVSQVKQVAQVEHKEVKPISKPVQAPVSTSNDDEEIKLEKTPMTVGDESLVFLASIMLLVIILILGYMYNQGRL
jgi:hypothetical protein